MKKHVDELLKSHVFNFNPHDNGGESLILQTHYISNGDPPDAEGTHFFTNQVLTLASYCNSASFNLYGAAFTPENLRKLADQLETIEKELKNET
jgi:hypothetical protein